jgi:hypothetical protein
VDDLIDS